MKTQKITESFLNELINLFNIRATFANENKQELVQLTEQVLIIFLKEKLYQSTEEITENFSNGSRPLM